MENEIMDPTGYGVVLPGWQPKVTYEQGIKWCAEYDMLKDKGNGKKSGN